MSFRTTKRCGLRPECGVLPPSSPRDILEPGLLWRRARPRTLLREANAHPGKVAAALHAPCGGRSSQASLGEVAGARAGGRSEGPRVAPSAPSAFESFPRLARGCEGLDLPRPGVRPSLGATVAFSGPREGRVAKGEPEGETWQRFPQAPSALAPRVAAPGGTESALSRVGAGPRPRGWGPLPGCAVTGRPGAPPVLAAPLLPGTCGVPLSLSLSLSWAFPRWKLPVPLPCRSPTLGRSTAPHPPAA